MKRILLLVLVLLLVPISSAAISITPKTPFPTTIVAGSQYTALYSFTNSDPSSLVVQFNIGAPTTQFNVTAYLNNYTLPLTEVSPNQFVSDSVILPSSSTNLLELSLSTPLATQPIDNVTYEVIVVSAEEYRAGGGGGGGGSGYTTPTPIPTAIPTSTPTPTSESVVVTPIPASPTPSSEATPTPTASTPESFSYKTVLLVIGAILVVILVLRFFVHVE